MKDIENNNCDLEKEIDNYNETKLFNEIEMPLALVLADMELTGIRVDRKYLLNLKVELETKMKLMEEEIYKFIQENR